MLSEIGSNFWLNPNQKFDKKNIGTPQQFKCKGVDYVWLSTGRSSIEFAIRAIEDSKPELKKVAVLPSFTCYTVFEPFLKRGYEVYYYPVERDLTTTSDAILETVFQYDASIVLFHRYFGFDTLDKQVNRMCDILRGLGKYTIEDCTQCLYSDIPRSDSDFTVGSIRKWTGTPDGGFIVSHRMRLNNKPDSYDVELEKAKVEASYAKYYYLFEHQGDKGEILAMYRRAEDILDNQAEFYAISEMSVMVQSNLVKQELIRKRRENYEILGNYLTSYLQPVFILGTNKEVPLYFPVLVEDRTALQKHMVNNAIYAPVVWPKDDNQPTQCEGAENAYNHLLCIPIDQRYGVDDMKRIVKVINDFYTKS